MAASTMAGSTGQGLAEIIKSDRLLTEVFTTPQGLEGITEFRELVKLGAPIPKVLVLSTDKIVKDAYLREIKLRDYIRNTVIPSLEEDTYIHIGEERVHSRSSGISRAYNEYKRRD